MRTKEQFEKDFETELNEGVLTISATLSDHTIFVLQDGTIIDAQFDEFECRLTDHRQVLLDSRYTIDDLVTIEPETGTVILPINGLSSEQYKILQKLDTVYDDIYFEESNINCMNNTIELIQWLHEAGVSTETIFCIIESGSFAEIDETELDDYDETEKDELIYTSSSIFDVW